VQVRYGGALSDAEQLARAYLVSAQNFEIRLYIMVDVPSKRVRVRLLSEMTSYHQIVQEPRTTGLGQHVGKDK